MGLIKGLVRASFWLNRFSLASFFQKIIFGAGFYSGVYASQNYTVPPIDDPKKLWDKLQEILKEYEKKKWSFKGFCINKRNNETNKSVFFSSFFFIFTKNFF
jgi:hypothetical protein